MKDWFDELYEQALPVVYGYFFRRCGGRVDVAEELTQETFVSVVRSIDGGASVEAPMPWLISIARRRLVDHYRRQRRHRDTFGEFLSDNEAVCPPVMTTVVEARLITRVFPRRSRLQGRGSGRALCRHSHLGSGRLDVDADHTPAANT